jgi:hypothetical protein
VNRPIVEFWVVRVLMHKPKRTPVRIEDMTAAAALTTLALVNTGDLCCLPDGSIAEPVQVFDHELDAHAHAVKLRADFPSADFRVLLSTDATV